MWEAIKIILIACAGILTGATFGYVKGFDIGYKQGYERYRKEAIIKKRYGGIE